MVTGRQKLGRIDPMAKTLLNDAIEDFALFRKSNGLSRSTLANDRVILRSLLASVGNIHLDRITERHITTWASDRANGRKAATLRQDHVCLNYFFGWARDTRRMALDHNPMARRRAPKVPERERQRISVSKFPLLLDAAENRGCSRDRALVALGLYTLLREQEIATVRVRDLDLSGGYIFARIHKTAVEDRLPIINELDSELRRWLTSYSELCGELDPDWYLVPRRNTALERGPDGTWQPAGGKMKLEPTLRLGKGSVIVNKYLAEVGIDLEEGGEGMHTLRRSGARAMYDALTAEGVVNADRIVQTILHHKSLMQTHHYMGLKEDRRTRDQLLKGKVVYGFDHVTQLGPKVVASGQGESVAPTLRRVRTTGAGSASLRDHDAGRGTAQARSV